MAVIPPKKDELDPALRVRIKQMCLRLAQPSWMPNPDGWVWRRPDGVEQGFGRYWRAEPGMANLLWLTMDFRRPPGTYDGRDNGLYTLVMLQAATSKLNGHPLLNLAACASLRVFHRHLSSAQAPRNDLERAYPALALLAKRRLDANP